VNLNDVFVRYDEHLPYCINGCVREDPNGDYNIYINPRLSFDMQQETISHELRHVQSEDFKNYLSIQEVEGF
jgi:hypothetical protein